MGFIYTFEFPNGKVYVGQTVRKKVTDRWRAHRNRAADKSGNCRLLGNAIRKYGWESIKRNVVEVVEDHNLDERESYWISKLNSFHSGYNLTPGGDANPMKQDSVVERLKQTLARPDVKQKRSIAQKISRNDPNKKVNWIATQTAAHQTDLFRAKISESNKRRWADDIQRKKRIEGIRAGLARRNHEKLAAMTPEKRAKRLELNAKRRVQYAERRVASVPGSQYCRRDSTTGREFVKLSWASDSDED